MAAIIIKNSLELDNSKEVNQENKVVKTDDQVTVSDSSVAEKPLSNKNNNSFFTLKEIEVQKADDANFKYHSKFSCNECSCYSEGQCDDSPSNEQEDPAKNKAQTPFKLG